LAVVAGSMPDETSITSCECGLIQYWARLADSPVRFKQEFNEYVLLSPDGRFEYMMNYCFWCGGRLPQSTRGARFSSMDLEECRDAQKLLGKLKSVADVTSLLGRPDALVYHDAKTEHGWVSHLVYGGRWRTLEAVITESVGGSIKCYLRPKYLRAGRAIQRKGLWWIIAKLVAPWRRPPPATG